MALIVDTCGLLSLVGFADRVLSANAKAAIESADAVYVLSCSLFEIAIKHKKGILDISPFENAMELWERVVSEYELAELPVVGKTFYTASRLEDHHADPFDRIIIAEAISRKIDVVTYDAIFLSYGVGIIN